MSQVVQSQYLWVAKTSGNLDIDILREVTKRVTLELDDPHPLQKREGRQLQDHKDINSIKNDKIVIKGIFCDICLKQVTPHKNGGG